MAAKGKHADTPAGPEDAWTAPDPKTLSERGRYASVVKLLDGCNAQTRRAVVRWVVAAELDAARDAYRVAHGEGEAYRAKLLRLAGASTKLAAQTMADHLWGLERAEEAAGLLLRVATSTDTAGEALAKAMETMRDLAGPWRDARPGAEDGHGIASLDDDSSRVSRMREEAAQLHARWMAKATTPR